MKVLLAYAHPQPDSFVAAVRASAVAGLRAAGHEVDLLDLDAEGFEPRLPLHEWRAQQQRRPPMASDVLAHAERLRRAEALVLVYPTWWGAQPAIMKGWLERVWVDGVAFHRAPGTRRASAGLRNIRRLVAITTHGSPKRVNAIEGEPGKRIVLRQMRALCHPLVRTRWLALYGVDQSDDAARRTFLRKVERSMARL